MSERLRIVHVIGNLGVGGAEKQLLGLIKRLDRNRFETQVICYSLSEDSLATHFREAGAEVIEFDKFAMPVWRFFCRLQRCIRQCAPHVVHTWLYSANFWGRWAAVSLGVRAIIASDRAEVVRCGRALRASEWLLRRRTLRLANSAIVAQSLEVKLKIPASSVRIIHNAVELPSIDIEGARREIRREIGADDQQKLVLMVGRQTWEKNYGVFVRAADAVLTKRDDVIFVAVGRSAGDPCVAQELARARTPNVVRFVGQRDDVHRWYAAADLFCLTSETEGFPNVVLEAMWSRCPVICTNFASAGEVISDPSIGVIVPRGDAARLAAEVERLLDDENERKSLGIAARTHVRKHYSWEALVQKMDQLYVECARRT